MTTLKISDLSVGDWVSFDTEYLVVEGDDIAATFVKKAQQPARIKSISGEQDLIFAEVETEYDFGTMYLKMEHIRPIPITAEILEKNGFEENCGSWYNSEARMEFEQYKDGWCRTINCGEYSVYFIKYVHQLQHGLRLAGVDKEINL